MTSYAGGRILVDPLLGCAAGGRYRPAGSTMLGAMRTEIRRRSTPAPRRMARDGSRPLPRLARVRCSTSARTSPATGRHGSSAELLVRPNPAGSRCSTSWLDNALEAVVDSLSRAPRPDLHNDPPAAKRLRRPRSVASPGHRLGELDVRGQPVRPRAARLLVALVPGHRRGLVVARRGAVLPTTTTSRSGCVPTSCTSAWTTSPTTRSSARSTDEMELVCRRTAEARAGSETATGPACGRIWSCRTGRACAHGAPHLLRHVASRGDSRRCRIRQGLAGSPRHRAPRVRGKRAPGAGRRGRRRAGDAGLELPRRRRARRGASSSRRGGSTASCTAAAPTT